MGVQDSLTEDGADLVLFNNPITKTTLAFPLTDLSVINVRDKIETSSRQFLGKPVKLTRAAATKLLEKARELVKEIEQLILEEKS